MAKAKNTKLLANFDCPGGGQVWVEGNYLFVGHMRQPTGTTIVDISDPRKPKAVAKVEVPDGWHSHKVRVANGVMVVNHEKQGPSGDLEFGGGLGIYDVSKPAEPKLITKWRTQGKGVHRYDFDGRYAYISPTAEGYVGNIAMILDLQDPANPKEVGRWWIPGQWKAGGEEYPWENWTPPRCHHPMRRGNRLYVSYWHHGYYILDIEDMSKPKLIAGGNTSPAFPHPTHTCLPIPEPLKGRKIMVVADEDVGQALARGAGLHLDLRHHQRALPDPDCDLAGRGPGQGWFAPAADDGLPPALRAVQGDHHSLRLVRPGSADPRYRRSLRAEGNRLLRAGRTARL